LRQQNYKINESTNNEDIPHFLTQGSSFYHITKRPIIYSKISIQHHFITSIEKAQWHKKYQSYYKQTT